MILYGDRDQNIQGHWKVMSVINPHIFYHCGNVYVLQILLDF